MRIFVNCAASCSLPHVLYGQPWKSACRTCKWILCGEVAQPLPLLKALIDAMQTDKSADGAHRLQEYWERRKNGLLTLQLQQGFGRTWPGVDEMILTQE